MACADGIRKFMTVFQDSELIFEEGSTGQEMFIIYSGSVRLTKTTAGQDRDVAILKAGDFFGEMALVDAAPRSVSAYAHEENTRLISVDQNKFVFLISHQPAFALTIMHELCQRIRSQNVELCGEPGSESIPG